MPDAAVETYELKDAFPPESVFREAVRANPPTIREIGPGAALIECMAGNVLVSYGDDGVAFVDCYVDWLAEDAVRLVRELTNRPIRFAIPTHFHYDHSGGAAHFASLGASIVGVEQARVRMASDHVVSHLGSLCPADPDGRPDLTFTDSLVLHLNGDEVRLWHPGPAHTDTDCVAYFPRANVVHLGDIFVNYAMHTTGFSSYPYLDLAGGADSRGVLRAVESVLDVCDDRTVVVPGHGPVATREDLRAYLALMQAAHAGVQRYVDAGASRAEVLEAASEILRDHWLPQPQLVTPSVYLSDVHASLCCGQ